MICFVCKKLYNFDELIIHFRYFHFLTSDSYYKCTEKNCGQTFSNLSSFKRHVNFKHTYSLANVSVNENTNEITNQSFTFSDGDKEEEEVDQTMKMNSSLNIDQLFESTSLFSLKLLQKTNITTKDLLFIQKEITNYILETMIIGIESLISKNELKSNFDLYVFLDACKSAFKYCGTEYRLRLWLRQKDFLQPLRVFTIDNQIAHVHECGELLLKDKKSVGIIFPLKFQFQKTFEKSNNLVETIKILNKSIQNNVIENFIQGSLWQNTINKINKTPLKDKIVIPFILYLDDLEINNPLGTHSGVQSVTVIKYIFPTLQFASNAINIFPAGIIKANYIKIFGVNRCLAPFIDEFKMLENEGIEIKTQKGMQTIYFSLALIIGDNLALNTTLNFTKSFSSNYFCRFCKIQLIRFLLYLLTDVRHVTVLILIHYVLKPTNKVCTKDKSGKNFWKKFTIKDSQESFIICAPSIVAVEKIIQDKKQQVSLEKRSLQPFMFVIGENPLQCTSYHVYLDGIIYNMYSPVAALDCVFKIFHVFNLKYPMESEAVWQFFQIYHYGLKTNNDVCYPSIDLLINKLKVK